MPQDRTSLRPGERAIEPRGGKFRARWWDGETRRSRTFATHDEAVAHLADVAHDKRLGRYTEPAALTVRQLLHQYLARNGGSLSPNTINAYRRRAKLHILPALGELRVHDLSTPRLQHWVDRLNRTLSPETVSGVVRVLSGALREAAGLTIIPSNPAQGLKLATVRGEEYPTWTATQARAMLAHTAADPLLGPFYAVALQTGLRPGELRALMWSDLDWSRGALTVKRTMTRDADGHERIGSQTKTSRRRTVALTPATLAALRQRRTRQTARRLARARWQETDLIFDRGDGGFLTQSVLDRAHKRACRAAGVPAIRLHDLRHTAATLLLEANVHPKIVSELLGHSTVEFTLDRYSHVSLDLQARAAEALGDVLSVAQDEARDA